MSNHAANPAACRYVFRACLSGLNREPRAYIGGPNSPSLVTGHANSNRAALWQTSSPGADENFAPERVCRYVSRLLFGHCFGAFPAPCGSSLFCFGCAALRVTVSLQILFGKYVEKISPDPP